jgi:hypothetical protein
MHHGACMEDPLGLVHGANRDRTGDLLLAKQTGESAQIARVCRRTGPNRGEREHAKYDGIRPDSTGLWHQQTALVPQPGLAQRRARKGAAFLTATISPLSVLWRCP